MPRDNTKSPLKTPTQHLVVSLAGFPWRVLYVGFTGLHWEDMRSVCAGSVLVPLQVLCQTGPAAEVPETQGTFEVSLDDITTACAMRVQSEPNLHDNCAPRGVGRVLFIAVARCGGPCIIGTDIAAPNVQTSRL